MSGCRRIDAGSWDLLRHRIVPLACTVVCDFRAVHLYYIPWVFPGSWVILFRGYWYRLSLVFIYGSGGETLLRGLFHSLQYTRRVGNREKFLHVRGFHGFLFTLWPPSIRILWLKWSNYVGYLRLYPRHYHLTRRVRRFSKISSGSQWRLVIDILSPYRTLAQASIQSIPSVVLLPHPWTAIPSAILWLTSLLIISFAHVVLGPDQSGHWPVPISR